MSVRRRGNGLTAESYVLLLDVDPRLADALLAALAKVGVAAYTTPTTGRSGAFLEMHPPTRPLEAVHVDSTRRPDARRVLESTMPDVTVGLPSVEEEDQFAALVAGWDDVPEDHPWPAAEDLAPTRRPASEPGDATGPPRRRRTDVQPDGPGPQSQRPPSTDPAPPTDRTRPVGPSLDKPDAAAESESEPKSESESEPESESESDASSTGKAETSTATERAKADSAAEHAAGADGVDDAYDPTDHYVPPHLPPLPPSHPVTKWGLVALGLGLVLLIFPMLLGLEHTTAVDFAGVLCILGAVGLLVSRLSGRSTDDYEGPDDGAIV